MLCFFGFDFWCFLWDSVVSDDWVVISRWSAVVVSGSWSVVVSTVCDLGLGFSDEGEVMGLCMLNFSSVNC